MSYSAEDILSQLQADEDSVWEFKQVAFAGNRPSRDEWADEVAAFANARGGVLLCGVTDDGEAQGMSREQIVALDALLVEVSPDSIKPPVRIHTWRKTLPEGGQGRRVLLLEVPESDSQHDSLGGSYVRAGASKRRMTNDERLRLAQRRGQARFRWFDIRVRFHELGLIERWGSEVQRMMAACRTAGLAEPEPEEIGTRFRVTLRTARSGDGIVDEVERVVLETLASGDGLSTREIAAAIGRTPRTARNRLINRLERGLVREVGTGPHDPRKRCYLM